MAATCTSDACCHQCARRSASGQRCPLLGLLHWAGLLRWTGPVLVPSCQLQHTPADTCAGQARARLARMTSRAGWDDVTSSRLRELVPARAAGRHPRGFWMPIAAAMNTAVKTGEIPQMFSETQCRQKWVRMFKADKSVNAGSSPVSQADNPLTRAAAAPASVSLAPPV